MWRIKMAVSKCSCLNLSNVINSWMPKSHWFLCINSWYLQPYWPLQQTSNMQSHKDTYSSTIKVIARLIKSKRHWIQTMLSVRVYAQTFFLLFFFSWLKLMRITGKVAKPFYGKKIYVWVLLVTAITKEN